MTAVLSTLFFLAAIACAMTIGPQTRPWTWGPAMVCLAIALVFGLVRLLRKDVRIPGTFLLSVGLATTAWFVWRAKTSPVGEFALADLLLLAAAVGAFCWVRLIDGHVLSQRLFHWGIAAALVANLLVIFWQWRNPGYLPLFGAIPIEGGRTGFFAHYIEAANFLVVTSMWTAAAAMWGPHWKLTRILFLLIALAGLAGVAATTARGGIIGAAVAAGVFLVFLLIQAKKRKAKWFGPVVITIPILMVGVGIFLLFGLQAAIKKRAEKDTSMSIGATMDNISRLYAMGIAWECVADHPLDGGGSRSFGWEAFRHSKSKNLGNMMTHRMEYAHNEFLQVTADYGLIGLALVCILLICFGLSGINFTLFGAPNAPPDPGDALRLGGYAGLAGLLAQAFFAFSLHLIPGAILLGTCIGMIFLNDRTKKEHRTSPGLRLGFAILAFLTAGFLAYHGVRGSLATKALWETEYGKARDLPLGKRVDNVGTALEHWKSSSLYGIRAKVYQELAGAPGGDLFAEAAPLAISDYREAANLNPMEPVFAVNTAHLLSLMGSTEEAEEWFAKAVDLQGSQEPAFRVRYIFAMHLERKAMDQIKKGQADEGLQTLEEARRQSEEAISLMHWADYENMDLRIHILERLGILYESRGNLAGALDAYQNAANLWKGVHMHFHLARVQAKLANEIWQKRQPERALALFEDAMASLNRAPHLPSGVTQADADDLRNTLSHSIEFLKGARIQPKR